MMKEKITVAESIVQSFVKEEIKHVFCVPGESYLPLLDALYEQSEEIEVISTRHEGGATFMAEAYAKCTSKPAIVLATRGVGATNASIGVHTAYQDSTPMILLLGQVHRKFRHKEGFQEIDLEKYFAPISKWVIEVNDSERMPEIMQRAMRVAVTGRPGPVVISLPEDMLQEKIAPVPYRQVVRPTPAPSKSEQIAIKEILQQAKRPLLIAGGGVKSARAERELIQLVEHFNLPTFVSFRRHDIYPHDNKQFIGHLGLGKSKHTEEAFHNADVIIALGTRLSEVTTKDYTLIRPHQQLIHIDIDNEVLGKTEEPTLGIVACAKQAVLSMLELNVTVAWRTWTERLRNDYISERKMKLQRAESFNTSVIMQLQKELPNDAVITNDAGNFASWLHDFFVFTKPHTYVGPTSGAMGYGLPAAIGTKLAFPEKIIVTLAGDGGFMMTVQEIETAVRYNIPVICLVFNNNMYGTIRMHQEMHYPKRVVGTNLGAVSFRELAESMGAVGYTVETIEEFEDALREAIEGERVTVIDILTDPEQINVTKTIDQIREQHKNTE